MAGWLILVGSDIEPTKATEVYAKQFYEMLEKRATLELIDNEEGTETLVFRGKLMEVFTSLGISSMYYTRIRKIFIKYDCVTYLQRGSRAYDSVLILNHPPPENLTAEDLTHVPGPDTLTALAERVASLENTAKGLENWREGTGGINIVELARNFEGRIAALEVKLTGDVNGQTKIKS